MSTWRLILLLVVMAGSTAATTFEDTVQPILESNCLPCHGQSTLTSGFSIKDAESVIVGGARHGPAVRAGDPAGSVLIKALRGEMTPQMPLGEPALAEADVAAIEAWIRQLDAPTAPPTDRTHWAFVQPRREEPPGAQNVQWVRNGIDDFILAKLEENGLAPAQEASRETLIRRLYFDLIGLPPPWEEVEAFVRDTSPAAYDKLVDRLLADPRHGERWARHWLDLARYADTSGYEGDPENYHTWRYRDYVVDAFNHDKPYDQFINEQIAGDEFVRSLSAGRFPHPNRSTLLH